jgi:hypothetical protein
MAPLTHLNHLYARVSDAPSIGLGIGLGTGLGLLFIVIGGALLLIRRGRRVDVPISAGRTSAGPTGNGANGHGTAEPEISEVTK